MTTHRHAAIELNKEEFKQMGYKLIDSIADFINNIDKKPVTTGESPKQIQQLLGTASLPEHGTNAAVILEKATDLLMNHSLFNGHPKFMGYITSSAAPVGALADLLAAAVNPNVGANILSPMATAIEKQTVKWLAEFIGVSSTYDGVLVSGGNMANFTAFLAARTAKAPKNLKAEGLAKAGADMVMYCSKTTHTWIEKAAVLFGHGMNAIRWIAADANNRMNNDVLIKTIEEDLKHGKKPFLVIGTAGDVSTGAVDDLKGLVLICNKYDLWFHVDGAYGIPAAVLPEQKERFAGVEEADSIALDPHKWLYSPLEAGCTLVKDPNHLIDTFSSHPVYFNFDNSDEILSQNFYEYSLQNSRGFRALKVWIMLQQVGRSGYMKMISDDIKLSKLMFDLADQHPELEAITQNLSITTLRYVPSKLENYSDATEAYLNKLNEALLNDLQQGGEVFLSHGVIGNKYCLRGCIVNFRTSEKDIHEIIEIIVKEGRKIQSQMKNEEPSMQL